jgi:hypothetical protein
MGELTRFAARTRRRHGEPDQVPDFIALRGDPSDKVPGASGVGAKGAAALLRRYGTLEALLGLIGRIAKKVSAVGPDGKTLGEAGTRESTETIVKCIASDDPRLREK